MYEITVRGTSILRIRFFPDLTSNFGRIVEFTHLPPAIQDRIASKIHEPSS